METLLAVRGGECNYLYENLMECNDKNKRDYARLCKNIRDELQMCAITNKVGELK